MMVSATSSRKATSSGVKSSEPPTFLSVAVQPLRKNSAPTTVAPNNNATLDTASLLFILTVLKNLKISQFENLKMKKTIWLDLFDGGHHLICTFSNFQISTFVFKDFLFSIHPLQNLQPLLLMPYRLKMG